MWMTAAAVASVRTVCWPQANPNPNCVHPKQGLGMSAPFCPACGSLLEMDTGRGAACCSSCGYARGFERAPPMRPPPLAALGRRLVPSQTCKTA